VLAAYLLDKDLYNGEMLDMLKTEKKLTSRVNSLPDTYSFSKQDFKSDELEMGKVIFGTSEYIKDGLIPLNEYIGKSPWQDRMMEMLDDLSEHLVYLENMEEFSYYHAPAEEVNGEMLQTLARVYWMTGEQKYLDWAIKIGDYYLLGERNLTQIDYLRIRDHGCEIIGGLSELYVTLHFVNPEKKEQYKTAFYKLLDRVLEIGRNEDGLFYNAINPKTGEIVDKQIVDNWGYVFDAYYSVWMVDKKEAYREAVLKGFTKLNEKYRNYAWEGTSHDGYADALESGINLYKREPVPGLKSWIDSEMQVMFAMQQPDGIIGGWHGDGNFARTAIMYSLWKTEGATIQPWRNDVIIGAEKTGGEIYFVLTAENDWNGKLVFDAQRHKTILNLPIDYPRINQFPEWFTAKKGEEYSIVSSQKEITGKYTGSQLLKGIPIKLKGGEQVIVAVE
ncbi:MAG: glycoside hydrolase family 76 protein, partial [Draconibacterium sp.]|nr:glycoside hydrolase family 76 protein [Draconibacterium sp.]